MPIVLRTPNVRYNEKEFDLLVPILQEYCEIVYPGLITDWSAPGVIQVIVDFLAYIGDQGAYAQDAWAREFFPATAKLRQSLYNYAKSIGYQPATPTAATALVRVTLQQDTAFDVPIPANSTLTTADQVPLRFRVLGDETIPAGSEGDYIDIWVEHSELLSESFVADGSANQEFSTTRYPILSSGIDQAGDVADDVFQFTVEAIPFDEVGNFTSSTPTSSHYRKEFDNLGRAKVICGTGLKGLAPTGTVQISGRYGGGSNGNNARITSGPALYNLNGDPVSVSWYNSVLSSGGADAETNEEIKVNAPLSLQSSNNTVSLQDFITNSESVSGVERAKPFTSNEDPTIEENFTQVVVLPESPANAQLIGGNAAATTTTDGASDTVRISIHGESVKTIDLGTLGTGEAIAAALQAAIRAITPDFPLDNAEAYSGFTVEFDDVNIRYVLTSGQAGLNSSIAMSTGAADAVAGMKLTTGLQTSNIPGSEPSAATTAAVTTMLTETKPIMVTHGIEVVGPDVIPIYIVVSVRFASNVTTAEARVAVRNDIRERMAEFFAPRLTTGLANPEIDFGATVRISDLISVVNETDGVESLNEDTFSLNSTFEDVAIDTREFPVLGGISVYNEATGLIV